MKNKTKNWALKFIAVFIISFLIGWAMCSFLFQGMKLPEDEEEIYPEIYVKFAYFDDHEEINNTAGFLIKCYTSLTENQIQTLRNSGVKLLQASEIATIYHSLIEENKVEEVENLDFVEYVYPYRTREFCGWSTYAKCKTDADCNMGGCSGQVCEGKGEGTITDCMWRDCYDVAEYGCKCVDDKCQWSK